MRGQERGCVRGQRGGGLSGGGQWWGGEGVRGGTEGGGGVGKGERAAERGVIAIGVGQCSAGGGGGVGSRAKRIARWVSERVGGGVGGTNVGVGAKRVARGVDTRTTTTTHAAKGGRAESAGGVSVGVGKGVGGGLGGGTAVRLGVCLRVSVGASIAGCGVGAKAEGGGLGEGASRRRDRETEQRGLKSRGEEAGGGQCVRCTCGGLHRIKCDVWGRRRWGGLSGRRGRVVSHFLIRERPGICHHRRRGWGCRLLSRWGRGRWG